MSLRIITDSASDIGQNEFEDVTVLPLSVTFGETTYKDGVDLSHEDFYNLLIETDELPVTSQINPHAFDEVFREAVEAGDEVIAVTLSSKLSGTCQSAHTAAASYPHKAWVVDSLNASIGERLLVMRARELAHTSASPDEIVQTLEKERDDIHLVALLNTLEYLKRGGRISSATAIAGSLLSIKPVITIEAGEVIMLGKARGSKNGNNLLIQEIMKTNGIDFDKPYYLGYTGLNDHLLCKYIEDSKTLWDKKVDHLPVSTIGATIGTHVGPGAIAVAFFAQDATA